MTVIAVIFVLFFTGSLDMFSEARATRAVKFFESLKHTKGKFFGQPFTLLPWERQIVRDVYGTLKDDGTRQYKYAYIEVPKKNGKASWQPAQPCISSSQMERGRARCMGAQRTGRRPRSCSTWRWT